ncbi:hypothetical protein ILT44_19810 [Microvirga sp. BT689]|uniref:hypothetical protein n=1 Tax=Microvirga arvi TaxID=2778731 RepID=UPI00194EA6EB|nr:hypothetical protein [Microvirga arvi]MBM6582454.1 hypothetical protein [Microvirga arvi]
MQPQDLLPLEGFRQLAVRSILEEFGGRHPTMLEISSIPDSQLLKLPGFGPSTIGRIRSLLNGEQNDINLSLKNTYEDLLYELDRLLENVTKSQMDHYQHQKRMIDKMQRILVGLRARSSSLKQL